MKTILRITSSAAIIILSFISGLQGQSPDLVNYQAVIRNAAGEIITGTSVEITMSILQGSSSGNEIYSEIHNKETNSFGLVGLEIGNGTTTGDFSVIDWSAGPYFLKIEVDGQVMSISQILSVPYSKYASVAGNAFSGNYNDLTNKPLFITSETDPLFSSHVSSTIISGNLTDWNKAYSWGNHALAGYLKTYTETDPVFTLSAAKNITPVNIADWSSAFGWGNHALAGYLTSTEWTKEGDSLYYNGGNVGIGTSDPRSTLSVYGSSPNDSSIFEVKNNLGQTVFAVYNDGVRITIDEDYAKGPRGGFAIGGFDRTKGLVQEYLRVTADSTRIYVNENASKGPRGGFAIGGFDRSGTKGALYNFVNLTPENYLIGHSAGENITWGTKNVFIGYEAGMTNSSGYNNVFLGYRAGLATVSSDNIFIGTETGVTNTNGLNNVFIGSQAGNSNIGGSTNVFLGYHAGFTNSTASGSVFIGEDAGYFNNASRNIYIGRWTGKNNSSGEDNVFVGSYSGSTMTGGRYNTFIGVESANFAEGGDENTYIGHRSAYDNHGSRNVVIGDLAGSNENNYDNPSTAFDNSVFIGASSGYKNRYGDYNVFIGRNAGYNNVDGLNNTYLGSSAGSGATGSNNVFIGFEAGLSETGDNKLYIHNNSYSAPLIYGEFSANISTQLLRVNGKMEIKSIAVGSGETLVVDATGRILKVSSSKRYKTDIADMNGKLASFMLLRPVEFKWNENTGTPGKRDFGFIAEEVEKIDQQLVTYNQEGTAEGVSYHNIAVMSVSIIQEQQNEIELLRKKQTESENEIIELTRRLQETEQKIEAILNALK